MFAAFSPIEYRLNSPTIKAKGKTNIAIVSDIATADPEANRATTGVRSDVPQDGHPNPIIAKSAANELQPIN